MNRALGNHGRTVVFTDPVEAAPVDQGESLGQLVADMQAGKVETLLILGGNPGVHGAGRRALRRGAEQGRLPRTPRPLRGRDLGALPLASARGALPGGVERRAGVRRHGEHPATADRAALRGTDGARGGVGAAGRTAVRIRHRAGVLEEPAPQRRLRGLLAQGPARRPDRRTPRFPPRSRPGRASFPRPRRLPPRGWTSSSGPTPPSGTAASPTTAGCRSCPSRSPSSPGTMRP